MRVALQVHLMSILSKRLHVRDESPLHDSLPFVLAPQTKCSLHLALAPLLVRAEFAARPSQCCVELVMKIKPCYASPSRLAKEQSRRNVCLDKRSTRGVMHLATTCSRSRRRDLLTPDGSCGARLPTGTRSASPVHPPATSAPSFRLPDLCRSGV